MSRPVHRLYEPSRPDRQATAVIYLRVSTREQAEAGGEAEGYSIPAQRDACRRKAESLEAHIVEEFVERGESGTSITKRPELQRLLEYVNDTPVDYVIVHKVDRLARSRADDAMISLQFQQSGTRLISCTESIDETPSGMLLHGIMASIAEFYSRNLAHEVVKGSIEKAKRGGTVSKAPLGYLNRREIVDGREIRTVAIDPERAPLIQWAFEQYATGDWTTRTLTEELNARGLRTVPGPRTPSRPVSVSHLHRCLRNPYYKGIVRYKGVAYEGAHEPLIAAELWQHVQDILDSKDHAKVRERKHEHYLKGSIYCGTCESRLMISHNRNHQGRIYSYFVCIGRQRDSSSCNQRALPITDVEEELIDHYKTRQVKAEDAQLVREFLRGEFARVSTDVEDTARRQALVIRRLERQRQKLLDSYYANAIPLDLFKQEQERITKELDAAQAVIDRARVDAKLVEDNLGRATELLPRVHTVYADAAPRVRRQLNQAMFRRILIDPDLRVVSEVRAPWDSLYDPQIRRAARRRHKLATGAASRQEGDLVAIAARGTENPGVNFHGRGSSNEHLVGVGVLEPGQTVRVEVEGIGSLVNPVVARPAALQSTDNRTERS